MISAEKIINFGSFNASGVLGLAHTDTEFDLPNIGNNNEDEKNRLKFIMFFKPKNKTRGRNFLHELTYQRRGKQTGRRRQHLRSLFEFL